MSPYLFAGYAIPVLVFSAYTLWMSLKKQSLKREIAEHSGENDAQE